MESKNRYHSILFLAPLFSQRSKNPICIFFPLLAIRSSSRQLPFPFLMFNNTLRGYGKKVKPLPILGEPAGLTQTHTVGLKSPFSVWLGVPLAGVSHKL